METLQQLAIKWTERQAALGLKGKKAETAAYEFFTGATVALQLAAHPDADHVGTCTVLVLGSAPFPLGTIAGWAIGRTSPAAAAA